jgi:hypothetical protein
MAKEGFQRNSRTVADILHNDAGLKAAVTAARDNVFAEMNDPEAFTVEYDTDRYVAAIVLPADTQAKHGTATRAAGTVGLTPG